MPSVDIASGQPVRIPALELTSGHPFQGAVRASDGETLIVEVQEREKGCLPDRFDEMAMLVWEIEGMQRVCPVRLQARSPRVLIARVKLQERRDSPRVPVELDMLYEVIDAQHVHEAVEEVMARLNQFQDGASEVSRLMRANDDPMAALHDEVSTIHEMLTALTAKVDDMHAVMAGLAPGSNARRIKQPLSILNCSGTGIGILVGEGHPEGEYLRIRLTLRTAPQTVIDCVGVVVRSAVLERPSTDSGPLRYDVGIRFTHIHEADRERIIQYLFRVQRRLLRDRKEAREALVRQG